MLAKTPGSKTSQSKYKQNSDTGRATCVGLFSGSAQHLDLVITKGWRVGGGGVGGVGRGCWGRCRAF